MSKTDISEKKLETLIMRHMTSGDGFFPDGLALQEPPDATADVVTGKLDVRAAAAKLPDPEEAPVPEEAEAMEEEAEEEDALA
jgi:hypothetical protein